MRLPQLTRVLHRWGSVIVLVPLLLVIPTGILLLLKKEFAWIQPPTRTGTADQPGTTNLDLSFERILEISRGVPETEIQTWDDVDRLDVRPGRGMLKVRSKNRWEIQLDAKTGEILQVAYRRSDLIESLHDGSFFHDDAKLWVLLPNALVLLGMLGTGAYLFLLPHLAKRKRRQNANQTE
ncbi:MAG: PepSY domain-containing protein [Planctomycetota bacterium]